MEIIIRIFGEGKDLNALQMSCRAVVIFLFTLMLIRIAGRRSFGIRTPMDNIIVILLGAILSRAVVGASDFVPVLVTCFTIVLLHRMVGWAVSRHKNFAKIIEGNKILLFHNNSFLKENLNKALLCEEDVMQGVRKSTLVEDMGKIDKVYIERNGEISSIKK